MVGEIGSWFVVSGVNTLAGIGQVGNGGFDWFFARKLIEALVGDSGKSLGAVGLVVANEVVEFLNVDVDILYICEESHVLAGAFLVPATVFNVLAPEMLRKVGVVSKLGDSPSRDERAIDRLAYSHMRILISAPHIH